MINFEIKFENINNDGYNIWWWIWKKVFDIIESEKKDKWTVFDFVYNEKYWANFLESTNNPELHKKWISIKLNWKRITIHKNLLKKLFEVLSSDNLKWLDCINFARNITWKNIEIEKWNWKNKNLTLDFDENNLKIWDVLAFTKIEQKLNNNEWNWYTFHFIINIWGWLFIYKPWRNTPAYISKLSEINNNPEFLEYNYLYKYET